MFVHVYASIVGVVHESMAMSASTPYSCTHCCPLPQCPIHPQLAAHNDGCQTEDGSPVGGEEKGEWSGEEDTYNR